MLPSFNYNTFVSSIPLYDKTVSAKAFIGETCSQLISMISGATIPFSKSPTFQSAINLSCDSIYAVKDLEENNVDSGLDRFEQVLVNTRDIGIECLPQQISDNPQIDNTQVNDGIDNKALPYLSQIAKGIKNIFYRNSIFFALNNEAITDEAKKYQHLQESKFTNDVTLFAIGFKEGVLNILPRFLLAFTTINLVTNINKLTINRPLETPPSVAPNFSLYGLIAGSIAEEIIFRGVLQSSIVKLQKFGASTISEDWQKNKAIKWITSPSASILLANSVFALAHLSNSGGYLSTTGAILQISGIFLLPTQSNLAETTGGLMAPIGSHISNNLIALLSMQKISEIKLF